MESSVPEDKFLSTAQEIVENAVAGAIQIIIDENAVKNAYDMEALTCYSSSSSGKEQDSVAQTANELATEVTDKAQDLTENRIKESDEFVEGLSLEVVDDEKEMLREMKLETDCARKVSSQTCFSEDAVDQPKEAEKTQTAKTLQARVQHASVLDSVTANAVSSSKSLNVDELYGIKKDVPPTRASFPNLKCFESSLAISVSPAISSRRDLSDKENAVENESRHENMMSWSRQRSPLNSLAGKDSSCRKRQDDSSASSLVSGGSRTVSVGLLGLTVGASFERKISNGIFDLQKVPSDCVSPTRLAVSSSRVHPSTCQDDRGEKWREQDCQSRTDCEPSDISLGRDETIYETGVFTELGNLDAAKEFIMHSGVQTEQGQDIFVIDPSKIPGKRDFEQKKEFKDAISSLCLYARSYIQYNIRSEKFLLVVHTPNDTRSRMKSREPLKTFYKLLKDSFSERLVKCVVYKPEFKLKAFVHICRPFLQRSMRNKFCTVRNQRSMVEVYGVPENVIEV